MKTILSFIGSGLGFGWAPLMPGTAGTVSGYLLLIFSTILYGWVGFTCFVFISFVLSVISLPSMTETYGEDPAPFVLDEWIGIAVGYGLLLFEGLHENYWWVVACFLIFRYFDISKVLGINAIQKMHGWFGVVFDDVLAGAYTLLTLKMLILVGYFIF